MKLFPTWKRMTTTVCLTLIVGLAILTSCQSRLLYYPNPYPPAQTSAFLKAGGERLDFTTSCGSQTAWIQRPAGNNIPERVWIVTAGNGSIALDLDDLPVMSGFSRDAFVFFDYPGYGMCQGKPHPDTIRESFKTAGPLILERCGLPAGSLAERGVVFGHSLGAGAALIAAEEYGIRRAVLLAPFTSTMDMTKVVLGVNLNWLVTHRFDNRARLKSLLKRGGEAWILHGTQDEVIPVAMGRTLATAGGSKVHYQEIPKGRHNNLMDSAPVQIVHAMRAARALP